MRKPGMSQCRVPYRLDRRDPVAGAVVTAAGGVAVVETAVAGVVAAAGEAVGYDGAVGAAVAVTLGQGTSQTWDWGWERGGRVDWVGSRNPRQRHGTLQSALREHEGPGG